MQKELSTAGFVPDNFTALILSELAQLEEPKPGTVARILIPILSEARLGKIPRPNVNVSPISDPFGTSKIIKIFLLDSNELCCDFGTDGSDGYVIKIHCRFDNVCTF